MRKITEESVDAFMNGRRFKKSNMEVCVDTVGTSKLFLHGNCIAERNRIGKYISITSCGWKTNTTKERLNGIPGVSIQQKNFEWYLNGNQWDGSWTDIGCPISGTEINPLGIAKVFMILGDLQGSSSEDAKLKYEEKIVFSTMRSMIPDWKPPSDWSTLPVSTKLDRLKRIKEEIL